VTGFCGRQIASGGADYLIRIWYVDVAKKELAALKEIKGHEGQSRSSPRFHRMARKSSPAAATAPSAGGTSRMAS